MKNIDIAMATFGLNHLFIKSIEIDFKKEYKV